MGRIIAATLSAVVIAAPLSSVDAGGFHYPANGAAAASRGGAFAAKANDPTALHYNPAGAANLKGTHILVNINLLHENVFYTNVSYDSAGAATRAAQVRNSDNVFPVPFIAATTDLGFLDRINMSLLLGAYGPNANRGHTFPSFCKRDAAGKVIDPCEGTDDSDPTKSSPAPQRYDLIFREALVIYPSIGAAWKPFKNMGIPLLADLSFGAVLQLGFNQLKFEQALGVIGGSIDVYAEVEASSGVRPIGLFGLHWAPLPFLEIGVSGRTPHTYEATGELCATGVPAPGKSRERCKAALGSLALITPNPVKIAIDVPQEWFIRSGVRYVHRDGQDRELFDVEVDFIYEGTGRVQDLTVRYLDEVSTALGTKLERPVEVPHRWKDTIGVALGGSFTMHDLIPNGRLVIRAGGNLETNGVPDEYTRLDFLPLSRYAFSVGFGLTWGRYTLDVGYSHIFHESRTVAPADPTKGTCGAESKDGKIVDTGTNCGSRILLLDPANAATGVGRAVGNGDYEASIDEVFLAITVAFGEGSH